MCWSATASLAFGATGVVVAGTAHQRGVGRGFTIPLAYFSLMEFLQFASYLYLNECSLTVNSVVTLLSYIHIAFQPLFMNMFFMWSMREHFSQQMKTYVYGASLIGTAIILLKLIPFNPSAVCAIGQTLCERTLCSMSGSWHLAWTVPQYVWPIPGDVMIYYSLVAFVLPLFYKAYTQVAYAVVLGPVLAFILASGSPLEWPSIWCFYSVWLLFYSLWMYSRRRE